MKKSNELIALFLTIVGSIVALAALIVAMLNWLSPFDPVGPSPIIINNEGPIQQNPSSASNNEPTVDPIVIVVTATSPVVLDPTMAPQSTNVQYDGWIICWHGKFGHEYLVAYPESTIKQGLDLSILLQQPWGGGAEYLPNDSLKMCLYDGVWYGEDSTPWFPYVSYIILKNDEFLVCQDSPSCSGDTWTMKKDETPPYLQALMTQPTGSDIQVLGYK